MIAPEDAPREWIAEAHLIARAAPGVGNPLDLTCVEFDGHLRCAISGHSPRSDDDAGWMRRYVERNA